jgi:hypothetical protein
MQAPPSKPGHLNNRNLIRGVFLMVVALVFGIWARSYQVGEFSRAGPGLFPLLVSSVLFVIGLITLIRSRFVAPAHIEFNFRNISLILVSLCGFALISQHVNMTAGIVFMVFCSTYAGTSYSLVRNIKISAVLVGIAFAMQHLLGVNLPLF